MRTTPTIPHRIRYAAIAFVILTAGASTPVPDATRTPASHPSDLHKLGTYPSYYEAVVATRAEQTTTWTTSPTHTALSLRR